MSRPARPGAWSGWLVGLLLGALGSGATAQAPGAAERPVLQPCRVAGIAHEVRCGSLQRPLDPARPQGPQIELNYLVVPALARRTLPDPVLLLAGGPGQSAISLAPQVLPLLRRLNNRRDLVFIDQRGTGRSAPLRCEPPDEAARSSLAEQADPDQVVQDLHQCRRRLEQLPYASSPGALGFFTTTLAVQDLDAVRQRLGYRQVNLVGASYGTRAGLEWLRQFPQTVRRAVLDGVAPPDMVLPASFSADGQAAFDALLAACEASPDCQASYPRLRADWAALLASLPRRINLLHPLTGRPESLLLSRDSLLSLVRGPLYVPALAAALPQALTDAAQGRFGPLAALGASMAPRGDSGLAMGMHFSVVCAEDLPRLDGSNEPPGRDFGHSVARLYQRVCADWPRGQVPAAFYQLPPAASPVLLLSGGLDPATPPRHARRVAQALGPQAVLLDVPNAGHGLLGQGCTSELVFRFIDEADAALARQVDGRCLQALPRPPAFVPVRATALPASAASVDVGGRR